MSSVDGEERIHFYTLNVGQKDSHVVHFPNQEAAIIIDPGSGELINELLHEHLKIKHLPLILITHFDMDHMGGLNKVLRECLENRDKEALKPGCIFCGDHVFYKSKFSTQVLKILDDFEQLIEKHGLLTECAIADRLSGGHFVNMISELGISGKIIFPKWVQQRMGYMEDDINLFSVVLYLTFANKKILYTGDLPAKGWETIAGEEDLKSDVFKVSHHGGLINSSPSSSAEHTRKILERVKPNFALISVGRNNSYGHPHPDVVEAIVTHHSNPHLFCTQMNKRCCPDVNMKTKIENFYEERLRTRFDKEIIKLGNHEGVLCAGTIRVTFDASCNEDQALKIIPAQVDHRDMLQAFFNPLEHLLCYPGISRELRMDNRQ